MIRKCWILVALTLSCTDERAARSHDPVPRSASGGTRSATVVEARGGTVARADTTDYPVVHGLYINRFAAQSSRRMRKLLDMADSTEINAFVIDMKDEFGLNYASPDPSHRRNAGAAHGTVRDVRALVDSVKAHGLLPIARIVAFKDPVAAAANPGWTIRRQDGSIWQDKEGHAWVNAFNKDVWAYNLGVADELVGLGFEEIQWDYIRFPEPYKSLPQQVFPGASMSKPDALAAFLKEADERLHRHGVRNTADIFGLVTTVKGPLEVGQDWEKLSRVADVLLPMVYPSHYPHKSFGIPYPNAEPYKVIRIALDTARARDERLGEKRAEHVRPWLQAFSIGKPEYGPEQIRQQKQAVYDAGYKGWVLWHPGSQYEPFMAGLDRTKPCVFGLPREGSPPLCAHLSPRARPASPDSARDTIRPR